MSSTDLYARFGPYGKEIWREEAEYLRTLSPSELDTFITRARSSAQRIAAQRQAGNRPEPSHTLVSFGRLPDLGVRRTIVDFAALFTDRDSPFGRGAESVLFAAYLRAILEMGGVDCTLAVGRARFTYAGGQTYERDHAWIELGEDVIDANVDTLTELADVPETLQVAPYWGPRDRLPGRTLQRLRTLPIEREAIEIGADFPRRRAAAIRFVQRVLESADTAAAS
ncbi:hypothetical protein HNR42_000172 [Deinobacterium chartae]|uniref:Uncharacterized protein n=1 Tax=Deinobacterium chartae TaxID=521158 RepID=A0A841HX32_9DEIO|nr:hypothetical protein [Deinobacterium chartae]MBB6096760.1 hypothetical protein [Deinobacterium chartae]